MRSARGIALAVIVYRVQGHISEILKIDRNDVHIELSFNELGIGPSEKQELLESIKNDEVLKCDLITELYSSIDASFIFDTDELVALIDGTVNGAISQSSFGMIEC